MFKTKKNEPEISDYEENYHLNRMVELFHLLEKKQAIINEHKRKLHELNPDKYPAPEPIN